MMHADDEHVLVDRVPQATLLNGDLGGGPA